VGLLLASLSNDRGLETAPRGGVSSFHLLELKEPLTSIYLVHPEESCCRRQTVLSPRLASFRYSRFTLFQAALALWHV